MKATGASFIIPLTFPDAYDVEDPLQAESYLRAIERLGACAKQPRHDGKSRHTLCYHIVWFNQRARFLDKPAYSYRPWLERNTGIKSLTEIPADMLGVSDKIGTLAKGKWPTSSSHLTACSKR